MAGVKILVKRPFEIRLDGKGEPLRFPCTILNGETIPQEHVVDKALLDHWYIKDQIGKGRVEIIGGKGELPPVNNMTIEDMTKAQLIEGIRQAQPEFDPGRMNKTQLIEAFKEIAVPKTSTEDAPDTGAESKTEEGQDAPDSSQEKQE